MRNPLGQPYNVGLFYFAYCDIVSNRKKEKNMEKIKKYVS